MSAEQSLPTRPPCNVYGFDKTRIVITHSPKMIAESAKNNDGSVASYVRLLMGELDPDYGPTRAAGDHGGSKGDTLLTPADGSTLVSFYCSKIPLLVGPQTYLPPLSLGCKGCVHRVRALPEVLPLKLGHVARSEVDARGIGVPGVKGQGLHDIGQAP